MKPAHRFKIYAKLLYLYPKSYHKQYAEQLLQTVADMVDDAPSSSEKVNVWLRISFDLPVTICKEHFKEIGDYMNTKNPYSISHNTYISGGLFLLPIIALAVNRMLMLSGPGRGIPSVTLIPLTVIFPILAIALSGSTLYTSWRNKKPGITSLWQVWSLALVCLLSLTLLTFIVAHQIWYYNFTH